MNHLEAHLYAALLEEPDLELPLVVLLVSGGHTMLVEMRGPRRVPAARPDRSTTPPARRSTRSPATSGSATRAGPPSTALAMDGDPSAIAFPRAMLDDGLDFSFSGLKTAVVNYVRKHPDVEHGRRGASFQEAVVDVLVAKARRAAAAVGAKGMCLGGGVAANSQLRERFLDACDGRRPPRLPAQPGDVHRQRRDGRRRRRGGGCAADGPSPLDTGADPNLRLPLSDRSERSLRSAVSAAADPLRQRRIRSVA